MNYQITTGFEFFYMDQPIDIGLKLQLKKKVVKEALVYSLEKSTEVCPYINMEIGIAESSDRYVLQNAKAKIQVKNEKGFDALALSASGRLFQVNYYDDTIYLLVHHGLTDGNGLSIIANIILAYYFHEAQGAPLNFDENELAEVMRNEGYADPLEYIRSVDAFPRKFNSHNVTLPNTNNQYCQEASIPFQKVKDYSSLVEGSVSGVLSLLMARALKQENYHNNGTVVIKCPVDLRETLGCPHTLRNCVKSVRYNYSNRMDKYPISDQFSLFKSMLMLQSSEETMLPAYEKEREEIRKFYKDYHTIEEKESLYTSSSEVEMDCYVSFVKNAISNQYESLLADCKMYLLRYYGQQAGLLALVHNGNINMTLCTNFENNTLLNTICHDLEEL